MVSMIQPGNRLSAKSDIGYQPEQNVTLVDSILGVFESLVPENLVQAAYNMDMYLVNIYFFQNEVTLYRLGVVSFSLALGVALGHLGDAGEPLFNVFHSLNEV